jgi:hypothetical protein
MCIFLYALKYKLITILFIKNLNIYLGSLYVCIYRYISIMYRRLFRDHRDTYIHIERYIYFCMHFEIKINFYSIPIKP